VESQPHTNRNDKCTAQNQHANIHRLTEVNENNLHKDQKTPRTNSAKPKIAQNTLPHLPTLESHNAHHQTKDPYCAQHFLGHKSLKSTEIYINIEHTLFEAGANDQFTVRIDETPEEIKELLEAGFEYVCQKDTLIFLRKRK
jgi:hypothetical protein